MKRPITRYEDHEDLAMAQLTLLEHFCRLGGLEIPTMKLVEFLEEGSDLANREASVASDPRE